MFEAQCDRVSPLVINPGRVLLTSEQLYFQPFNNLDPTPVVRVKLERIRSLLKRRFLLRQIVLLSHRATKVHVHFNFFGVLGFGAAHARRK